MDTHYDQYWISAGLILVVFIVFFFVFFKPAKRKRIVEEGDDSQLSDLDDLFEITGISDKNTELVMGKGLALSGRVLNVTLPSGKIVSLEKEKVLRYTIPLGERAAVHVIAIREEGPWSEFSVNEGMVYILGDSSERHPGLVRAWQELGELAKNPKAELSEAAKIVFAKNGWSVANYPTSLQTRKK